MAGALNLHDSVCREIETHRIGNETHSTALHHHCEHITQRPRLHTYSASTTSGSRPTQRTRRKRHGVVKQRSSSLCLPRTLGDSDDGKSKAENKVEVVMTGWLYKTTRLKTSKTRAHRQHRKFKLTAHSLEYSNLLQKVAIAIAVFT